MKTMTVNRALVELKLAEKKIESITSRTNNAIVCAKSQENDEGTKVLAAAIKSNYDKIKNLIDYRQNIKDAIIKSNAVTTVEIAGKSFTVAEAIERKTSYQFLSSLVNAVVSDVNSAKADVERRNASSKHNAEQHVAGMIQGEVAAETVADLVDDHYKRNEVVAVYDQNVFDDASANQDHILEFMAEIDLALTESNAVTQIEVAE